MICHQKIDASRQHVEELRGVIEEFMAEFSKLADAFDLSVATGTKFVFHFGASDEDTTYEVRTTATEMEMSIDLREAED